MNTLIASIGPILAITPFILLLAMIATGPVLYPHFWHRYYSIIAPSLGICVLAYYVFVMHDVNIPIHAVVDYIQFIALIGALYIASSGILIDVHITTSPMTNLLFLWSGAILSNLIGTTGASMLLIRPFIRLNGARTRAYHIIFFIFMVSNVGGALTAIADPPNFIGFLKGVPFFWTLEHNFLPWLVALSLLSVIFFILEKYHVHTIPVTTHKQPTTTGWFTLQGYSNIGWLTLVVMAVFIDPNVIPWVPSINYHGHHISFLREVILLVVSLLSYHYADKKILQVNGFSLEPLKEVVFIFMGIFGTMMPALVLIDELARSPLGQKSITPHMLYWSTGTLSSVLDNAPTYLNFLAAGMASKGFSIQSIQDVASYAHEAVNYLRATSVAAVFFGAMTYVGNGPNFMVRAIAMDQKIKMPSFGKYITHYSLPFLLPVLIFIWWLFFC